MKISINKTPEELGKKAAKKIAKHLNKAINAHGEANLLLSTGASQFQVIANLVEADVDWTKVSMFHLDEYVNLPETHIASFRKYLKERFVSHVSLKKAYFISGEGDVEANIKELASILRKTTIHVGVIGIGENGHVAFNDPPADFDTDEPIKIVELDEKCKMQQVREMWFNSIDEVPTQAVTMCIKQILSSQVIVSCVPHSVKAQAIKDTLSQSINPNVPATILKTHPNWHLYLDAESAKTFFTF